MYYIDVDLLKYITYSKKQDDFWNNYFYNKDKTKNLLKNAKIETIKNFHLLELNPNSIFIYHENGNIAGEIRLAQTNEIKFYRIIFVSEIKSIE